SCSRTKRLLRAFHSRRRPGAKALQIAYSLDARQESPGSKRRETGQAWSPAKPRRGVPEGPTETCYRVGAELLVVGRRNDHRRPVEMSKGRPASRTRAEHL